MSGGKMALLAELIPRLSQQPVIFASMRMVTACAATAFEGVAIDGFMLIGEWPPLFRMAVLAVSFEIIGQIVVLPFSEAMTIQAGDVLLKNGMVRILGELCFGIFMTAKTKLIIVIQQ
jgi:hypothetical protein